MPKKDYKYFLRNCNAVTIIMCSLKHVDACKATSASHEETVFITPHITDSSLLKQHSLLQNVG